MNQKDIIGPVNIGNPYEITIKELAIILIEIIETESNIIYQDLPKDDPMKRKPCIEKAKKTCDYIFIYTKQHW
jgi:UDP-glucuronate decarboxylase